MVNSKCFNTYNVGEFEIWTKAAPDGLIQTANLADFDFPPTAKSVIIIKFALQIKSRTHV